MPCCEPGRPITMPSFPSKHERPSRKPSHHHICHATSSRTLTRARPCHQHPHICPATSACTLDICAARSSSAENERPSHPNMSVLPTNGDPLRPCFPSHIQVLVYHDISLIWLDRCNDYSSSGAGRNKTPDAVATPLREEGGAGKSKSSNARLLH
jgi:hypothetical protein